MKPRFLATGPLGWLSALLMAAILGAQGQFESPAQAIGDGPAVKKLDLAGLQTAAGQGDPAAQVELGLRYTDGTGVPQDYARAAEWFRQAAMQGNAEGQLELGVMYVNGEGMAENPREGYAWYSLAAAQGNPIAKNYLSDLDGSLSAQDRQRARQRATELQQQIDAARTKKPKHGQHRQAAVQREPERNTNAPATKAGREKFVEGKDYTVWQRVRLLDENGFGQPAEAYSILLPKGWRTQGGVRWVVNAKCPADAIQNRMTATSPDQRFRLEVFPQATGSGSTIR